MTSYKALALIVVSVLLASCSKKDVHFSKDGATFYVDSITPAFYADELTNDVVSRKFINLTACIKDNAMSASVMNLKFQISAGGVSTVKSTDERGCLVWQELFSFQPLDHEKFIALERTITAVEGHSGSELVQLAYNPWKDKLSFLKREAVSVSNGITLQYDSGLGLSRAASTGSGDRIPVDIHTTTMSTNMQSYISNLTFDFLGRDFSQYEITPSLNLVIAHKYLFKFSTSLLRKTMDAGMTAQKISSGRFRFYFVLLKEGTDLGSVNPSDIVAANAFDADASLGEITKEATLRFHNITALASRMTAVLTITSVDQPHIFAESSFRGAVLPLNVPSKGVSLIPSALSAKELYHLTQNIFTQQAAMTGLKLFEKHAGFVASNSKPVAWPVPAGFGRTKNEMVDVVSIFKRKKAGQHVSPVEQSVYAKALCYKYFDGNNVQAGYDACLREPNRMISATGREFVEKINNSAARQVGFPDVGSINMSASFDFSEAKSKAKGSTSKSSVGWNAGLGGEIGVGMPLGPAKLSASLGGKISTGKEWYTMNSTTTSSGESAKVIAGRSVNVAFEGFTFAFNATTRSCMLIVPTDALKQVLGSVPAPAGKYICDDQAKTADVSETYYFLNESRNIGGSPLSDSMSAMDNPWRMFVRGKKALTVIKNSFEQKNIKLVLDKMPDSQVLKQFNEFYVTQEFPGMLSP